MLVSIKISAEEFDQERHVWRRSPRQILVPIEDLVFGYISGDKGLRFPHVVEILLSGDEDAGTRDSVEGSVGSV